MKITIRFFILMLISIILIGTISVSAQDDIKILLNNKPIVSDQPPVIIDGRTFVPIRAITEAMGCEVVWIAATQTANIKNETTIISLQIDNPYITIVKRNNPGDKKLITLDVPPQIIGDRTCVPVRAVAESFGAIVGWDAVSNSVLIVYDTTLKYAGNKSVYTFAGTGERQKHDSELDKMSFVSPESIDKADDGSIYIADAGVIRKIKDGKSETVEFEPKYITANMLRCYGNDVYILTNEFKNEQGVKYYGIVKLTNGVAEGIFLTEAVYSKITDFDFSQDGKLYVLQNNVGVGKNYIGVLNTSISNIEIISEIDSGITSLSVDKNGNIYLANSVKGSIYHFDVATKKIRLFAGVDNKTKFVDGPNPMFFEPRRIRYEEGYLYVLDYNVIRRISINDADIAIASETLAGKVSVEKDPETTNGKASETIFAPSYLMDFVVIDYGVLLTDPKKAVVRIVK